VAGEKVQHSLLGPADESCEQVYVLLYTLSADAPADFDYPATRKALRGHDEFSTARFVETDDGERRYLGAFVTSLPLAKKLVSTVEHGVPKSKPIALCGTPPPIRRDLNFDFGEKR
jgi:hypothetical protein